MKKFILILPLILIHIVTFAQAPTLQWLKVLGGTSDDFAYSIQQTSNGGYIMAGNTLSNDGNVSGNHGDHDAWVVKLDNSGNLEWQKTYGGTGDDRIFNIQTTTDGGYVMTGYTNSTDGDVTGDHGARDAWIVKLSNTGILQWQKALGGTTDEVAYYIQQTIDGGYVLTGYTQSNNGDVTGNHGVLDAWVVKLDNIGNLQWQKALGGTSTDQGYSIQQTSDGGYIMAGNTQSNDGDIIGNHGFVDAWVLKLNNSGDLLWQKALGGTGDDKALSIQQTLDGGYIMSGYTYSNDGDVSGNHGAWDAWLVKLDTNGILQWQKALGGTSYDLAYNVLQNTDGSYTFAGYTQSNNGNVSGNHGSTDAWIVKISNTGNLLWQKTLGGTTNEQANAVQITSGGCFILTGYTNSNDGDISGNHGGTDTWVSKLNPELSTDSFTLQELELIPNPANNLLQLKIPNQIEINQITITDLTGKIVIQTKNTSLINVQSLSNGIYFIEAISDKEMFVAKFVKE